MSEGAPIDAVACPFCGVPKIKPCDDSREGPTGSPTTPLAFWVECASWKCRARGPREASAERAVQSWGSRITAALKAASES